MKINREKLLEMWSVFEQLLEDKKSVKFHYNILKNKRLIQPEVDSLKESNDPPEKFQEFEQTRIKLCQDYSEKDDNGQVKTDNGSFVLVEETKEEFETKLKELKDDHKEMFEGMEKSHAEFMELLKEDVDIDFVKIPMSIMPDSLTGREVDLLFDIVEENA